MTSPQASRLTASHRRDLQTVAGLATRNTRAIVARANGDAIAEWWTAGAAQQVEDVIQTGHRAAVNLTVRYLQEHARLNGAEVFPVPAALDLEQVRGNLFVVGVGAYLSNLRRTKSKPLARQVLMSGLIGSVTRFVLAGERDTVMSTIRAGGG